MTKYNNNKDLFEAIDKFLDEVRYKKESAASASAGLPGFDMPHTGKPYKDKKEKQVFKNYNEQDEMINRENKRLLIDFDGVIHSYHEGYKDGSIYGYLLEGAKETIDELSKTHQIVIFTSRVSQSQNEESLNQIKKDIEDWLNKHEIYFDFITADKLAAVAYIDDNAIRFENNWSEIKNKIGSL